MINNEKRLILLKRIREIVMDRFLEHKCIKDAGISLHSQIYHEENKRSFISMSFKQYFNTALGGRYFELSGLSIIFDFEEKQYFLNPLDPLLLDVNSIFSFPIKDSLTFADKLIEELFEN